MPQYDYVARTRNGTPEKGVLEAPNLDEAISILHARDLLVLHLDSREADQQLIRLGTTRYHTGVKRSDLIVFARSLAAMTEAGLPLLRGLETTQAQVRSSRLAAALSDVVRDIRGGSTFRDALAKHPAIFSPYWISLMETGEASGQLTKALQQIAIHLEKAGTIERKVVSALIYPAVLASVAIVAILIFTLKIVPTFGSLFAGFGAELPLLTRMVMVISDIIRSYILLIIGVLVGLGFLLAAALRTKTGRWRFDKWRLQAPVFGPVFQGMYAEQFASNLATLLKAGVPILHALEITITTCSNRVVAALIEQMRSDVREGRSLAEPLAHTDLFPPMVAQMLAVGEQTGKLPDMLDEISRFYEEQVSTAIERMTSLLEPIMLIGMGAIIGLLVVSMYLPIFKLTQVVQG